MAFPHFQTNPLHFHKLCPISIHFQSISISIWISTPMKGSIQKARALTQAGPAQHGEGLGSTREGLGSTKEGPRIYTGRPRLHKGLQFTRFTQANPTLHRRARSLQRRARALIQMVPATTKAYKSSCGKAQVGGQPPHQLYRKLRSCREG